jgi:hypothetical protein
MFRAILAGGVAALAGLSAAGAWACSCALGDPQEMLRDADGALGLDPLPADRR